MLWAGDKFDFTTAVAGPVTDVSLLIISGEGVGFVRAGGFATPLLCVRSARGEG
jgi:hypothetical protein